MSSRTRCRYVSEYFDLDTRELVTFNCDMEAVEDGLCIFHHPNYWSRHPDVVRKTFYDKIREALNKGDKLLCIGYHLPDIEFPGKEVNVAIYFNYAHFHGKASFLYVKFYENVSFIGVRFSGKTEFLADFSKHAAFSEAVFQENVDFSGATFSGETTFSRAKFMKNVNFSGSTFLKTVDFTRTIFSEDTDLTGTTFSGDAIFMNSIFNGNLNSSDAKFKGCVTFSNVMFLKDVDFSNTVFSRTVEFSKGLFSATAIFSNTEFLEKAVFSNSTFRLKADFSEARFLGNADFSNAMFLGEAKFPRSTFLGNVTFSRTAFLADVDFSNTRFLSPVEFSRAVISRHVNFLNSTFSDHVDFSNTTFLGRTEFYYTRFLGEVVFHSTLFHPGFPLTELRLDECIVFKSVHFEDPEKVVFDNTDMSKVSFIDTDITKVKFRNVKWDEYDNRYIIYPERLLLLKKKGDYRYRYIVRALNNLKKLRDDEEELRRVVRDLYKLDEKGLDEKMSDIIKEIEKALNTEVRAWENFILERIEDQDLCEILITYRSLRENYENSLKYEIAGKFFISEMEAMKLSKRGVEKIIIGLYKHMCLYGESCTRPIIWSVITIVLFAIIKLYIQMPELLLPPLVMHNRINLMKLFIKNLEVSTYTFFQMYADLDILTLIERLLSIILLGCLFIALRRKIERRRVH